MEMRNYKNTEEKVSLLGFGCMRFPKVSPDKEDIDEAAAQAMIDYAYENGVNYFDTAYPYHGGMSETFTGKALKKYPRESFKLATKLPTWLLNKEEDAERLFNEQLEKCQVEYFDYYLIHGIDEEKFERSEKLHAYKFLTKMKEKGKIRHLGFSFHGKPEGLEKIAKAHAWDFAQIQLNYLDWDLQDAKRQYEILEDYNIPAIIMEPVRGGVLAELTEESAKLLKEVNPQDSIASWAIRYAASLPNVLTVLSGMSNYEQVEDNLKTMADFKPLSEKEYKVLEEATKIYFSAGTIPCTGCRYCIDCPAGVDIPNIFFMYNQYCINDNKKKFDMDYGFTPEEKKAHKCVECGNCIEHCPQGIQIPERLKEIHEFSRK